MCLPVTNEILQTFAAPLGAMAEGLTCSAAHEMACRDMYGGVPCISPLMLERSLNAVYNLVYSMEMK